ncbi:MAG: hypothetical protein FWD57_02155 [Polyangiaceae bacterium]|nr:hypothetical protein [Polyangiaceae bacterium]
MMMFEDWMRRASRAGGFILMICAVGVWTETLELRMAVRWMQTRRLGHRLEDDVLGFRMDVIVGCCRHAAFGRNLITMLRGALF